MIDLQQQLAENFAPDAIEWVIEHAQSALGVDVLPASLDDTDTATVMGVQPATVQIWRCTGDRKIQYIRTGRTARNSTVSVLRVLLESGNITLASREAS